MDKITQKSHLMIAVTANKNIRNMQPVMMSGRHISNMQNMCRPLIMTGCIFMSPLKNALVLSDWSYHFRSLWLSSSQGSQADKEKGLLAKRRRFGQPLQNTSCLQTGSMSQRKYPLSLLTMGMKNLLPVCILM